MSLKCLNGDQEMGAHDFQMPMSAGTDMEPLLYCRKCGEVRRLELGPSLDDPIGLPAQTVSPACGFCGLYHPFGFCAGGTVTTATDHT